MDIGPEAEKRYAALEDRFYLETVSEVRRSSASPLCKRQWLLEATKALADAEELLARNPHSSLDGPSQRLDAIEHAARDAR